MKTINYKFLLIMLISFIFSQGVKAQCSASFNYVDNGNGVITLQSTSDSIYNVWWQVDSNYIGNSGFTSITLPNGTYEVCMFIEDSATSCFNSTCQTITISGSVLPCNASISYVDNGNGNITFINNSVAGSGASYGWIFGDGNTSNLENPTHTYTSSGTYFVEFAVMDTNCIDSAFLAVTVNVNTSCQASISYIDNGNGNITFINNSVAGSGASYGWIFGDGNTSNLENPTHTYTSSGTYFVEFAVMDTNCIDSAFLAVTVNVNTSCTVVPMFSSVDNGNGSFTFTDASTTSSGGLMFGTWFFGDGSMGYTDEFNNSISHTYTANGVYVVVLEAYDSLDNCTAYYTQTIVVNGVSSPVACNAAFVMFPDSISNNSFVVVNSSTGSNLSYFWDFGDGNTSTQAYPNYTYATAGPFELCLTVSDGVGCTSTYCDSISDGGIILKQGGFTINVISPSSTLSVKDEDVFSDLNVYPNPVKETLNIEMDLVKNARLELFVTDITGKVVAQISNNENQVGKHNYQWNVGSLQNGIYLLNIKSDNNLQVKKVMINR
ncbi:MAG: hypothetical protein KFKLKKLM_02564 [Flavobacteriales bacterium]|nr:hypothetical protein [Flavobacteriales bacterium]